MKYNRDGSPDKQQTRHQILHQAIKHLQTNRGYGQRWKLNKLGRKDVSRLVHDWKQQGIAHRTIANRLAEVRWLASKIGRSDQIMSNKDAGLSLRKNAPGYGENKAKELDQDKLNQLDQRAKLVTELRREFGLRRAEALKFQHAYATQKKGAITLKSSWTKGGRPREIPITNQRQQELLERVKKHQIDHKEKSLIPRDRTFKSYAKDYDKQVKSKLGIKGHALRHQWAQDRFKKVSGLTAPIAGGKSRDQLSQHDKKAFDRAAAVVNRELGHGQGRQDITLAYIGH